MPSYKQWFQDHADKHKALVEKLLGQGLSQDEIIAYFRFENMVEHEKEFCELYKTKTKCHEMEDLNCYLCACPNFRFNKTPQQKNGKLIHSHCSIESKDGSTFEHEGNVHQDCSGCLVPHYENYIDKHFSTNWMEVMKECPNT